MEAPIICQSPAEGGLPQSPGFGGGWGGGTGTWGTGMWG